MRTRFVIHKNLLGRVFRVRPRYTIQSVVKWYPEDILVHNPDRPEHEGAYFILPKSEYIPCTVNGTLIAVVKGYHAETATVVNSGSE